MTHPHSFPLIIGIGNEYRSDDSVGLIVARRLKERLANSAIVIEQSGDGAALMEAWRGAFMVIIIDAVISGAAPGTIKRFDASAHLLPKSGFRCSTHAFGVAEAIELAGALGELPERLAIYGIEGKDFAAGVGLSPEVEKAAGEVIEQLLTELSSARQEMKCSGGNQTSLLS
jgi:hydrogenase maturation protease